MTTTAPINQSSYTTTGQQTSQSYGGSATSDAAQPSAITSDFTTFLQMLTVQMQNQDPLNPMDSTDFAVQLATFSGVEQAVQTNQLLESLIGQIGGSGITELANWVGMEARTSEPVYFYGNPVTVATEADPGADTAVLTVYDEANQPVYTGTVDVNEDLIDWDGTTSAGDLAENGNYTFKLTSYSQGQILSTRTAEAYGRVMEARLSDAGGIDLIMASGATVASDSVKALRSPD